MNRAKIASNGTFKIGTKFRSVCQTERSVFGRLLPELSSWCSMQDRLQSRARAQQKFGTGSSWSPAIAKKWRHYNIIDSIWQTMSFEYDRLNMTNQTLSMTRLMLSTITLRYQSLKTHLNLLSNSAVSLDRSSSPSSLCSHWLGHLHSLAGSHGFIECNMEGYG